MFFTKSKLGLLLAAACLVSSATAFADGAESSGGGPSIICNGADGKVQSARLLDLYEGNIRYGLTIPVSQAKAAEQLKAAFDRLAAYNWFIASDVEDALYAVESHITFLPPGVIMAPGVDLGDSHAAVIPNGCTLAYVGYYESDGTLRVSQDIWNLLDETNRAALFMHEALYKVARDIHSAHDSGDSREFNAYLFSAAGSLGALDSIAPEYTWKGNQIGTQDPVLVKKFEPAFGVTVKNAEPTTNYYMVCARTKSQYFNSGGGGYGQVSTMPSQVDARDCRVIGAMVASSTIGLVNLSIQYGTLTFSSTATSPGMGPQIMVPLYLDRTLAAPDKPLD